MDIYVAPVLDQSCERDRETANEFLLLPEHRTAAPGLFREFVTASGATEIQAERDRSIREE